MGLMLPNSNAFTVKWATGLVTAALLLVSPLALSACADDDTTGQTPTASLSDVTGLTLIRSGGEQVVRAQVLNPTQESSSYTVSVAIASPQGTKIGSTTVLVSDVAAGKKKSGASGPISPAVPVRSQLIVTGIERTVP